MAQKSIKVCDLERGEAPPSVVSSIGKRFGRLTILGYAGHRKCNPYVFCRCDCGAELISNALHVRNNRAKSCGCAKSALITAKLTRHGYKGRKVYRTWQAMLSRCRNPNNIGYLDYGGRGIIVCSRWVNSFECFLADMGEPIDPALTIERKNVNGNYEPDNCTWATRKEQAQNKRPRKR